MHVKYSNYSHPWPLLSFSHPISTCFLLTNYTHVFLFCDTLTLIRAMCVTVYLSLDNRTSCNNILKTTSRIYQQPILIMQWVGESRALSLKSKHDRLLMRPVQVTTTALSLWLKWLCHAHEKNGIMGPFSFSDSSTPSTLSPMMSLTVA